MAPVFVGPLLPRNPRFEEPVLKAWQSDRLRILKTSRSVEIVPNFSNRCDELEQRSGRVIEEFLAPGGGFVVNHVNVGYLRMGDRRRLAISSSSYLFI